MTARWTFVCLALLFSCITTSPQAGAATGPAPKAAAREQAPLFSARQYTEPASLVAAIARDAQRLFDRFFSPQGVAVRPFVFVDQDGNKHLTTLGLTLADAMSAAVDNTHLDPGHAGDTPQELRGVLQEIGDTVRVHIKGVNGEGRRRSYVAIIELSPPIYRLLHETLASAWRPRTPAP